VVASYGPVRARANVQERTCVSESFGAASCPFTRTRTRLPLLLLPSLTPPSSRYSSSRICPNYRVHELKNVPMAPGWTSFLSRKRIGGYRLSGKHIFEPPRSPAKHWKPDLPQTSNDEGSYQHHSATIGDSPSALALDSNFGELPGGRDIYPEYGHPESYLDAPVWTLIEDDLITVKVRRR